MKNVKSMIKKLSDEQEIHDLQDNILKSVDMNKVRPQVYTKPSHVKRFVLITNIFSALAAAMIVILIVLSVNGLNKPVEDNPSNETNSDVVADTKFEDDLVVFTQYLEKMRKQEAYNIINIVPSISNFSFDEVELSADPNNKKMTVSEEAALVNDLHSQIYNIEEMLNLTTIDCVASDNSYHDVNGNEFSDYEKMISVTGPLSKYHLYYSEINLTEQNVGKTNFKSNSVIQGKIDTTSNTYSFVGNRVYKNSKTTYLTTVELDDFNIKVNEVFGTDENEFTYTFYKDGEAIKNIYIKQMFDKEGNVRALRFFNGYTTINIEKKNVEDNSPIVFKVDSRDGDLLTINKNESNYEYTFKNSTNVYTR